MRADNIVVGVTVALVDLSAAEKWRQFRFYGRVIESRRRRFMSVN